MSETSRRSDAPNICMLMDDDVVERSAVAEPRSASPQRWRKREKATPSSMGAFVGSMSQAVKP